MNVNDTYTLNIKFDTETDYTSYDVITNTLKLTEIVHSGLKNVDNTCKCSIVHNQLLEDKLRLIGDEGVNAYVTCNGTRIFTGFIRRAFTFQKDYAVKATSIELVSPSFMLKRKLSSQIRLINPSVCYNEYSAVQKIFIAAGYSIDDLTNLPTITTRLPYLFADVDDKTYYDLINTLLYEYGYILDFDANGKPFCYPLVPSSVTPTKTFQTGKSGNVHGTLKQNVSMENYEKFSVQWDSVKSIENCTLFEDTSNATSAHDCVISVAPSSYYGEDEAGSEGLYCTYDNDDYELLYAYNEELTFETSSTNLALQEFTGYNTKGFLKAYNSSASITEYIYKLLITGTAIVVNSTNKTKVNNSDGLYAETLSYEAEYIYSSDAATSFISKLANHYKYADFNYNINSYDDFEIGAVVNLIDSNFGTIICRIIQKDTNCQTGLITYTVEGVGEYQPSSDVETTSDKETSNQSVTLNKVQIVVEGSIAEALDDLDLVDSPTIFADTTSFVFSVDASGNTPITQTISSLFHIIQYDEEVDFSFGDIVLPDGWEVTINYHTLTFNVSAGARVSTGYIKIPLIFKEVLENYQYGNEDEELYANEDGEIYGSFKFDSTSTEYILKLSYSGVKGGHYLGAFTDVSALPVSGEMIIGDYICWTGEDTENSLSEDGKFVQCALYAWNGIIWVKDELSADNSMALSDILSVSNADLENNNSTAYEYLDHLTANTIFTDRLMANNAFIESLFAKTIRLSEGGIIASNNYNGTIDENGKITDYGDAGWAIDYDGNSDFANINATGGTFDNVFIGGGANFAGYIASGPLYLDDEDPSSLEDQITFASGSSCESFITYVENTLGYDVLCNGLYGDIGFSYVQFGANKQTSDYGDYDHYTYLLDRKKNKVAEVKTYSGNMFSGSKSYSTFSVDVIFNLYTPGGKTLKLKDLPTNKSSLTGMVYQDSEGYLRIS